jgi:hypothetical protein
MKLFLDGFPALDYAARMVSLDAIKKAWEVAEIQHGRVALALVSRRTRKCPNRACARARHCLAEADILQPPPASSDCPLMSKAEWRACVSGIGRNLDDILAPFSGEQDAATHDPHPGGRNAAVAEPPPTRPARTARIAYWWLLWTVREGAYVSKMRAGKVPKLDAMVLDARRSSGCRCVRDTGQIAPKCAYRCRDNWRRRP